jgi:hypothetical protein
MNLSQLSLKKTITVLLLPALAFAFLFAGCESRGGTRGDQVSSPPRPGQVLIRLIDSPGFILPSVNAIPQWELYTDGTLLYQSQVGNPELLQAQLQPADIAHILDVVVNQDTFFRGKKSFYGLLPTDGGEMTLTVNVEKQQKSVELVGEAKAPEDQHLFAILHFLQSYRPAASHPYVAPGAVVLVHLPPFSDATAQGQWPYPDISMRQVAAQECKTLSSIDPPCAATSDPSGYFPIYGKRGTDLLKTTFREGIVSQEGQNYLIRVWPLLPENLVIRADGKQWVETDGWNGGRWPLLPGTH